MVTARQTAFLLGGLVGAGILVYYVLAKPPEVGAGITQVRLEVV